MNQSPLASPIASAVLIVSAGAAILLGSYAGGSWQQLATSSLGLLTTNVAEGSNPYWTNTRFDNRLSATTTLPNITTLANVASVGTITSGTWNSAIIGVPYGGTGWAAIASGAIPYGNGSSALSTTTAATGGQVLAFLNGVPTWTSTTTLSSISGTLDIGSGGTNATSFNSHTPRLHSIDYVATDNTGLTSTSTRTVIVSSPANDNRATSTPPAANDNQATTSAEAI